MYCRVIVTYMYALWRERTRALVLEHVLPSLNVQRKRRSLRNSTDTLYRQPIEGVEAFPLTLETKRTHAVS